MEGARAVDGARVQDLPLYRCMLVARRAGGCSVVWWLYGLALWWQLEKGEEVGVEDWRKEETCAVLVHLC